MAFFIVLAGEGSLITICMQSSGERPACRVWDRGDLLRRLQSYKANTWFCKPPGASPLDCARRGWVNTSLDMLTCEVRLSTDAICLYTSGSTVVVPGKLLLTGQHICNHVWE